MKRLIGICIFPSLAFCLVACAMPPPQESAQVEQVMKAQLAAAAPSKDAAPAMSGAEAERIYRNYLDGIGKPLEPRNGDSMAQP